MKDQYHAINPLDVRQHNFQNVKSIREVYGAVLKRDVFDGDENLVTYLNSAFQKRHVIVHKAGIIDKKACGEAGWKLELDGTKLILTPTSVSSDIDVIEKFAAKVDTVCRPKVT